MKNKDEVIQFDPDAVRTAIRRYKSDAEKYDEKRRKALALAETYQNLLDLHGYDPEYGEPLQDDKEGAPEASENSNGFHDLKLADAAYKILMDAGAPATSREILEELERRGRRIQSKNASTILNTAMRRDGRIARTHNKKKWTLKRGEREKAST